MHRGALREAVKAGALRPPHVRDVVAAGDLRQPDRGRHGEALDDADEEPVDGGGRGDHGDALEDLEALASVVAGRVRAEYRHGDRERGQRRVPRDELGPLVADRSPDQVPPVGDRRKEEPRGERGFHEHVGAAQRAPADDGAQGAARPAVDAVVRQAQKVDVERRQRERLAREDVEQGARDALPPRESAQLLHGPERHGDLGFLRVLGPDGQRAHLGQRVHVHELDPVGEKTHDLLAHLVEGPRVEDAGERHDDEPGDRRDPHRAHGHDPPQKVEDHDAAEGVERRVQHGRPGPARRGVGVDPVR